jgi:hypothetical protein
MFPNRFRPLALGSTLRRINTSSESTAPTPPSNTVNTNRCHRIIGFAIGSLLLAAAAHADHFPIDLAAAKRVFADAKSASDAEGGRLWGKKLYGHMLLVDPETRAVVANEPDPQGVLRASGGCFVGTLPKTLIISNAPTDWEGQRWTMLILPTIPDDPITRRVTLAHELFHRIQPELHLMADDTPSPDLDTAEGRVWLQLEWRALAAALIEHAPAQTVAIRDALAFRTRRHGLFPNSGKAEASQEIAEGIPQYTGIVAAEPDVYSARWRAAGTLAQPDVSISLVRSFSYTSGPGYGLLLDERLPGWRAKLSAQSDLATLLGTTLKGGVSVSAEDRAGYYGAAELRVAEADRAEKVEAAKSRYRALLVDGPTLALPKLGRFSFNPSTLVSLGDAGIVYPTFHAVAEWGTLDVKGGILIGPNFSRVTLAAPTAINGSHLQGPGWTIDLAAGWSAVPAARRGSYVLRR